MLQKIDFRHIPGQHCGSTALRNCANFFLKKKQISPPFDLNNEANCFGLGSGMGLCYALAKATPENYLMGRSLPLTENFLSVLKASYQIRQLATPNQLTQHVRQRIEKGLPTIVQSDVHFLPYYKSPMHFTGHTFVVVGENERGFITSDTQFKDWQIADINSFESAVSYPSPLFVGKNLCYDIDDLPEFTENHLKEAIYDSLKNTVINYEKAQNDYPEPEDKNFFQEVYSGFEAIDYFERNFEENFNQSMNKQEEALFLYQVIERRGTGGGNFRFLMATFLAEAAEFVKEIKLKQASEICLGLAHLWQSFANDFKQIFLSLSKKKSLNTKILLQACQTKQKICEGERQVIAQLSELT